MAAGAPAAEQIVAGEDHLVGEDHLGQASEKSEDKGNVDEEKTPSMAINAEMGLEVLWEREKEKLDAVG